MNKTYPVTLVVIRDCHAKNNLTVTAHNADDEALYRKMAAKKQWKVAVRKPKAEPTCDNCKHMDIVNTRDGSAHRRCGLHGQWIPDTEQFPACDFHSAMGGAFSLTLTPIATKGGTL